MFMFIIGFFNFIFARSFQKEAVIAPQKSRAIAGSLRYAIVDPHRWIERFFPGRKGENCWRMLAAARSLEQDQSPPPRQAQGR